MLDATTMNRPTILVVDDDKLIRWSLTERLTQDGYRLLEAETASEALARQREGLDLVLPDYRLPDGDGLAVLKKMKEVDPDTLVILLTGHSSVETVVEAMRQRATTTSPSRSPWTRSLSSSSGRPRRRGCDAR